MVNRVILIVLDSVGCGDAPDVALYSDDGSNTISNLAHAVGGINLPNLGKLGLGNMTDTMGVPPVSVTPGAFGRLTEMSAGKDTTTGHWELCGIILDHPFPTYPNGFPPDLISEFEMRIGRGTLGNYPASGTEIIKALGGEHLQTGKPIVYTSADSVFQIAAHEGLIPINRLYEFCQIARNMLIGEHAVGRVIARPFVGKDPVNFVRTERRKDFSLEPVKNTILDEIKRSNLQVMGVGKIEDIFANRGLTKSIHSGNNMAGVDAISEFIQMDMSGLIFANLVDFDSLYGHRNDPRGYADALEAFDARLPEIFQGMNRNDVLIITADHGNDPTTISTDHSRERVPLLVYGDKIKPNVNIGTRDSFTDLAATICDLLNIEWNGPGKSFINEIISY